MFSSKSKSNSSEYAPVALHDHVNDSIPTLEKRSSSEDEDDHSAPLLEAEDNLPALAPSKPSQLPKLILYFSFALALLSAVNVALLPTTLSKYRAYPFSDSELEALPYGDARLGLDRAAKMIPPPQVYHHVWPDRIARVSRKLKNAVWGQGVQVYVTVEDSTIMRFPIPSIGVNACALSWRPPPELSARAKDVTTKGDVTEIEVWQLIAPSATSANSIDELDYDALSYSTLPVRGELLGVLDLTAKPNSTTLDSKFQLRKPLSAVLCPTPIDRNMSTQLNAAFIARLSLHDPAHFNIQHSQTLHRLVLLEHWNIPTGSKVLELGCGQGDCTTVLAYAVGEQGNVEAVDPAELDYGAPYTLGQAQDHISQGPLGRRITWVHQSPLDYLSSLPSPSSTSSPPASESKTFDATVLAHCLWYFPSPSLILSTFRALKQHSKRLLLAEWSLVATHPSSQPHVLAALTQAALECRKPKSDSNVRTVLGPKRITELALAAGWQLESETHVQGGEGLLDGQWEVSACLSSSFEKEVEERVSDERERGVIIASRDACEASLEGVQGGRKGVRAMDVWAARFV
ncbi:SAM-dependent methyltransferase [Cucurbitaria berberidis CBS 394.84]|uniref:SAM-dependent methyltransferase n=1 Tax=Cucurbitaria berberidis CBS 394.84 TaxID=1168544 RepID=A0A9P4LC41_9PLEO|nr:SAM-dependent methyltransferase [Cucurbitaria berberidis CBS 394.84]KAF1848779.1 SAM-dependent methyltransferase [Cucurbitaria berberidis CBS 394.84]